MSRIVFKNGRILSFHDRFVNGQADTLVIDGDTIRAAGRWEDLQPLADPGARIIDLQGRTLMPGLHDTHIHVWKVGNLQTFMLDVRGTESLEDMLSMLEQYRRQFPEASWITARGFNEARWKEGRMPTRYDLDRVIPDKPVYVIRTCAHIAVGNSKALELAGVNEHTIAPAGGVIYKDNTGKPSGLFAETALGLITAHIPPYSKDELKIMYQSAREELYKTGITAATDPAVDPLLLEAYQELNAAGQLGLRLQAIPILLPDGGNDPFPIPELYHDDHFTINTVKFFSDGGLSGRTAALKGTYRNDSSQGVLRLQPDKFLDLARAAQEHGLGIATHAIGDTAIEMVIDVYKDLSKSFPGVMRRIEHLGLPEARHLEDMAAYDIAASMQTIFLRELGKNFISSLDEDYLRRCYPIRSVLQQGILLALSSDAPVVRNFNPFAGMETAITREVCEGEYIAQDESISVKDAGKAYTLSAARISSIPRLGSLEEGKWADLIITDADPLSAPARELSGIRVLETWVGGNCVYSSSKQ